MVGLPPTPPPSHKGDKLSHFKAEINCHIFYLHPPSLSRSGTDTEFQTDIFCSTRVVPQGGVGGMNGFEQEHIRTELSACIITFHQQHFWLILISLDVLYRDNSIFQSS